MNEKIASKAKNSVVEQKWCIRLMICANIRKASQDEQRNRTTTTKIIYIKNSCLFYKTKFNNKVKKS